jgi:hypothetical protein
MHSDHSGVPLSIEKKQAYFTLPHLYNRLYSAVGTARRSGSQTFTVLFCSLKDSINRRDLKARHRSHTILWTRLNVLAFHT